MRVALDGTPLTVPTGGIRRYTVELKRALTDCFPQHSYELFSEQLNPPSGWIYRRWWTFGLRRELSRWGADLFHGTDFTVPYSRSRPSVMTVHDLSPWMDQETSARVRRRAPLLMRHAATMIITPTAAIRSAVIEKFRLPKEKVVAVPLAANSHFRPVAPALPFPYFLYVGTLERRKNLGVVIEACRAAGVPLVVAGRARPGQNLENEPNLKVLGAVRDEALPGLYSGALACLYPSLYEGFGLPVLEAMQCGAPVIASTDPAIREVAGDAALLIDPADTAAWSAAIQNAETNPGIRNDLRIKGLERAKAFSWERTARLTQEVYEEAIRRHGR
jgi:glycosyltransferase involved in cell wall biosynthesis